MIASLIWFLRLHGCIFNMISTTTWLHISYDLYNMFASFIWFLQLHDCIFHMISTTCLHLSYDLYNYMFASFIWSLQHVCIFNMISTTTWLHLSYEFYNYTILYLINFIFCKWYANKIICLCGVVQQIRSSLPHLNVVSASVLMFLSTGLVVYFTSCCYTHTCSCLGVSPVSSIYSSFIRKSNSFL